MPITNAWRAATIVVASLFAGSAAQAQPLFEDNVNLLIDAATGATQIENLTGGSIDLVGFTINSPQSTLNPAGLTVLPGLEAAPNNSASNLGQIASFPALTGTTLPAGTTSLGTASAANFSAQIVAAQTAVGFGNPVDALTFEFDTATPDFSIFSGDVIVENGQSNNFVLEVNATTGEIVFNNDSSLDVEIAAITIESPLAVLNPAGFTGFSGAGRVAGWELATAQNSIANLAELLNPTVTAVDTILGGESISLGNAYTPGALEDEDLAFTVALVGGEGVAAGDLGLFSGNVVFIEDVPAAAGDFNADGVVSAADYTSFRDNLGALDETPINNNGDGVNGVDAADFSVFVSNFDTATTAPLAASVSAVPEPGTLTLLALSLSSVGVLRRRR